MKTFEITFTKNPESGIYSANIVHATSAEQATAYYTAKGYEVIGCSETASRPKPGQPVTTVPEDWKAPTEEINVETLAEGLNTGDHGDRLNDYRNSSTYICDAIADIADNDTSIYYSDILNFIRENPEALAEVVAEGLYTVEAGQKYDLYEHGQAAEFMMIERDIYNHLADSLMICAVDFIRYDLERNTIPAELSELLEEWTKEANSGDRMDEIPDHIREYLEEFEEAKAEEMRSVNHD